MTILLIDHDAKFRGTLATVLREDGHAVQEHALPGDLPPLEALGEVSLAIVDHAVPRANQLAFVDAFHQVNPGTPILILAAYWSLELAGKVAARPFASLVRKPIGYEELRTLVRDIDAERVSSQR